MQVQLIRVFVSSPGDVAAERAVVDEVVAVINRTDGGADGFRLETFRWEQHVTPQIGPKPQTVVDRQTPEYDVYVGIMSTRFGTPTGPYGSGTEKEFKDALKRWQAAGTPWITFYFDEGPKSLSEPEDIEQYLKVTRFRKRLQKQGIVRGYQGVRGKSDGFYELLSEHLRSIARTVREKAAQTARPPEPPDDPKHEPPAPTRPPIPRDYLTWLRGKCADVDQLGLRLQQGQAITLQHVYVPLTTLPELEAQTLGTRSDRLGTRDEDRPVQTLLDLLGKQSLYIPGPPGSGKTTFCRWVAWMVCDGALPESPVPAPDKYQEAFPPAFRDRLPLLVRLREFWDFLPSTPGCRDMTRAELESALSRWIDAKRPDGLTGDLVRAHLDFGSLLLILDGVDEVPLTHGDAPHECQPRDLLLSGLVSSLDPWIRQGNRVLLTSRPYGLRDGDSGRLRLHTARLDDLDEPMRVLLVRRWFRSLSQNAEAAEQMAEQMLQHIQQRADLQPLTINPMLLTSMCILYHQGRRLPQHRHELYHRIVDNVLFNRFPDDRTVIDPARNRLAVIAYGMHTGEGLDEERVTPQAEVTYAEIDRMLWHYDEQTSWSEAAYTGAVAARELLLSRTGLLLPQAEQRAGFYHLTLQDFLAAQRLLDLHEEDLFEIFCQRAEVSEWRSTLGFVLGSQLAKHSSPQRSTKLLEQLIDALAEDRVGLAVVVGQCLQILIKRGVRLRPRFEQQFGRYCIAAIQREVPLRDRFELGLALGDVGDPRIVTDLRDPAAYVPIPAGTYRVGDDQLQQEHGWCEAETTIEMRSPLWFSKYPVTNSQFRPFLEAGGYHDRQWWSADGWQWREQNGITEPRFWQDTKWNGLNQPVVGVSYWEAEAFANWIGGRLPTSHEWEAAARGPDGFAYPWGTEWEDGICNSDAAGLGQTSAVGIFPRSRSPLGLEDLAGNVWEWCNEPIWATIRVIRGGSWAFVPGYCRSAFRSGFVPGLRFGYLGFRVVAVPSGSGRVGQEQETSAAESVAQADGGRA